MHGKIFILKTRESQSQVYTPQCAKSTRQKSNARAALETLFIYTLATRIPIRYLTISMHERVVSRAALVVASSVYRASQATSPRWATGDLDLDHRPSTLLANLTARDRAECARSSPPCSVRCRYRMRPREDHDFFTCFALYMPN
jgi:hypothetical protein